MQQAAEDVDYAFFKGAFVYIRDDQGIPDAVQHVAARVPRTYRGITEIELQSITAGRGVVSHVVNMRYLKLCCNQHQRREAFIRALEQRLDTYIGTTRVTAASVLSEVRMEATGSSLEHIPQTTIRLQPIPEDIEIQMAGTNPYAACDRNIPVLNAEQVMTVVGSLCSQTIISP